MKILIILSLTSILLIKITTSLRPLETVDNKKHSNEGILLSKIIDLIRNKGRRSILSGRSTANDRNLLKHLLNHKSGVRTVALSEQGVDDMKDTQAILIETELKTALAHKKSALFDAPYVEKHGKNDFLVIEPNMRDPFVTIIPNNIYYNIEKKCVNWLDDCNLKGIKAKFLTGVRSPYMK